MKISDSNQLGSAGLDRSRQAEALAGYGATGTGNRSKSGSDEVNLSGLAARLSEAVNTDSPQRLARLDRLSRDVAAGRYRPPAAEVSHSMVEEVLATGAPEIQ